MLGKSRRSPSRPASTRPRRLSRHPIEALIHAIEALIDATQAAVDALKLQGVFVLLGCYPAKLCDNPAKRFRGIVLGRFQGGDAALKVLDIAHGVSLSHFPMLANAAREPIHGWLRYAVPLTAACSGGV